MRRAALAFLAAVVFTGVAPLASMASTEGATTHRVVTVGNLYVPGDRSQAELPPQVIFQGDSLNHTNLDSAEHDLIANGFGPDGKPWFDSPLIGAGETAAVPVEDLKPGTYSYTCSIHPFMQGSIRVEPVPGSQPQEPGQERLVVSGDSFFNPKTLTVPVGTTVRWRNDGQISHSVTAADGSFDSSPGCPQAPCWGPGQTFTHKFTSAGTVPYYCKLHGTPQGTGHAGTIIVVDPATQPTTVGTVSASPVSGSVSVSGTATFGGQPPQLVGEDGAGDPPIGAETAQFGVDLLSVSISQPDPDKPEIQFTWKVSRLDSAPPPEIVRYLWQMKLAGKEYWIQAKTTDFLSGTNVTDDPPGHASHTAGAFKLRGNCGPIVAQVPSVTTCRHVAWLTGEFDAAKDEIRVRVPLGQSFAPEFVPGAEVTPFGVAEAGFQVALSNAQLADQLTWETPFSIPAKSVRLGIAPAGTDPTEVAFSTTATLGSNGSFSGSVPTTGLAPGSYDVWAKACFAENCGLRSARITI